ncbi:MAG: DUF1552 domain-containing protein [Alphaproteobacteria bacterium]|nr:DUF1552 domain-containing protein [Alphaproteobacteria bacterium]
MRAPLSRRTVLRGLFQGSAVAVGLPLLDAMLTSKAWACGGLPKRFGVFLWGNGTLPDRWTPTGSGSGDAWSLSESLAPLAAVKDAICVVSGTSVKLPNLVPHGSGLSGLLSGAPLSTDALESFTAPTVDQLVADAIGRDTLYKSLQTAASGTNGFSFSGANARHPAEQDPYAFFQKLFGPTFVEPGSGGIVDPKLGLRRSVLDAVMADIDALNGVVGAEDRTRLDQHLTGVRELETRLARLQEDPPDLEACHRPGEPLEAYPDEEGRAQTAARNRAMAGVLAMALACDQTRVFSHTLTEPVNNLLFPGAPDGHHNLTHDEPGTQPQVHEIILQIVAMYAEFIEALRAIPEGGGTLLESCLVLGCSDVSLGRTHSLDEMPIVLAGGACGAIRMDHHYRSTTLESSSKVVLSCLRAMDVVVGEFGTGEARATDGITEIET